MPRFSILIPTRERPATFRHTLATVAAQPGDDYEIVVADNCCGPETRAIVDACAGANIRYTRSDEVLPMATNWERGLALCTAEYVTVLGDDDAFLPSTLVMARRMADATQAEILSWFPHVYWWPDTIVPWYRNTLGVYGVGNSAIEEVKSRTVLERFYRNDIAFGYIPMIYNSFFHRNVIEEAQRRYDGFFVPPDTAPDVSSGILGMHVTESYVFLHRPLTIHGNSGKSIGTAQWARSLGAERREVYFREERVGLRGFIHKALPPSPNIGIIIASAKLKCKEAYFPGDAALEVDLNGVLAEMINTLNDEPEAYADNLFDAKALATMLGVQLNPAAIPPMKPKNRMRYWGPMVNEDKSVSFTVNGELAQLRNIEDAARLADALTPPFAA